MLHEWTPATSPSQWLSISIQRRQAPDSTEGGYNPSIDVHCGPQARVTSVRGVTMNHRMTFRKILMRGLLAIGILIAAVVLFFAGDHDDPDQDAPKPTLGAHHPNG
jgi:hypothetical protein